MAENQNFAQPQKNEKVSKTLLIVLGILMASFVSIFGIFNTFSDLNVIEMIWHTEDTKEKIANFGIVILFMMTMLALQGIHFKRKGLFEKGHILLAVGAMIAAIGFLMFFFSNNIMYPLISIAIIGLTLFLFELVFITIGVKGLFFILIIFSIGLVSLLKNGQIHEISTIITLVEIAFALILFFGATWPRLKSLILRIGTRDNVELDNNGVDYNNEGDDD